MNQNMYAAALRAYRRWLQTSAGVRTTTRDLEDGVLTPEFRAAAMQALKERTAASMAERRR